MDQKLRLYCNTDQLVNLRQFLNGKLSGTTMSEIESMQVILAVEEVCANLIIHSHECNPTEFIELNVMRKNGSIVIEIKDYGRGFNILEYQEPNIDQVLKTKRKGGLGIMLVKKIMDKIEFESNGTKNICRLFKNL
ncbi:ATP-binding protein [Mongoliibacter ruber]|uniref:Serine/threonine-protein kinase RsbW n=1 Tax=Mongoliibacter ruber TaxID=1750599 RepID=A0A2T0WRD6_9BACT|nr:ATP-binding protein [Mongoliibacter ruber]PRY89237.1 serine/threonine-protein kinase RsbW [Mongoliibacter ruber]